MFYIPVSSDEEGVKIGNALLEQKLVACANIVPSMTSMYWWKGAIEKDNESLLLVKTLKEKVEKVETTVKDIHSYECPCIMRLPVEGVNQEYLDWVKEQMV